MAADAIVTESGALHVAGVPFVNPSTVVVWGVMPGLGNGIQATAKINATSSVPPSLNPPSWPGFAPLAAYLFSLQDYLVFRRRQSPRLLANSQKNQDSAIQKIQHMMNAKTEDNSTTVRSGIGAAKVEDGQSTLGGQFVLGAKGAEENPIGKSVRIGSGNAGQEEWHRRNMFGGPWSEPDDFGPLDNMPRLKISGSINSHLSDMEEDAGSSIGIHSLWPRKCGLSEREAAFGLKTSVGLGGYLGVMGSRSDVVTAVWRTGLDGEWYKVWEIRRVRVRDREIQTKREGWSYDGKSTARAIAATPRLAVRDAEPTELQAVARLGDTAPPEQPPLASARRRRAAGAAAACLSSEMPRRRSHRSPRMGQGHLHAATAHLECHRMRWSRSKPRPFAAASVGCLSFPLSSVR
ncbi:unnamed protein product [Miscanthus lutarioriparius]|uniref:Uncharacterized protein n=1 Tax=Miscanthus lutarioriparius TaxID=422564 RepID=A0A811MDK0_9POAL|nr:unnamed protein product [Miscanthus lutarioriparius]